MCACVYEQVCKFICKQTPQRAVKGRGVVIDENLFLIISDVYTCVQIHSPDHNKLRTLLDRTLIGHTCTCM